MRIEKLLITVLLCGVTFKFFPQDENKISFYSGTLINSQVDASKKHYTSAGYFLKLAYEGKIGSTRNLSFFMPIGISFLSRSGKYTSSSAISLMGLNKNASDIVKNKDINLFYGPAIQFQNAKWRFAAALFLNACLTVSSKPEQYLDSGEDLNIYLSSQLSALFHIKKNIWLGPACEIFFNNVGYSLDKAVNNKNYLDANVYSMNMAGKNIWINPGIKLEIDLK